MCTHYVTPEQRALEAAWANLGAHPFEHLEYEQHLYPASVGPVIKYDRPKGLKEMAIGQFGLVPDWVKSGEFKKYAKNTYNARTETVHEKPSFKMSWKDQNFCIIPAQAIYEPCYDVEYIKSLDPEYASRPGVFGEIEVIQREGQEDYLKASKSVPIKISRLDGKIMWIAGICWSYKNRETGEYKETYSMLTINADDHEMFKHFHKYGDERRIVVMLKDEDIEGWLAASHDEARTYFCQYPAELLKAEVSPIPPKKKKTDIPAEPADDQLFGI